MFHENHQLAYRCPQLKTAGKIFFAWFFSNKVKLKLIDNVAVYKITHTADIEKLFEIDNLDEFLNNISF